MTWLIVGLLVFLVPHSIGLAAPQWRARYVARLGEKPWKGLYSLVSLVGFVLIAAAYVPRTKIKAALGHPMTAGVALWAFAHLLANGQLHDVVLFGAFLVWSVATFVIRRSRDRESGTTYPPGTVAKDAIAIVAGIVVSVGFALFLHGPLIGVRPFG